MTLSEATEYEVTIGAKDKMLASLRDAVDARSLCSESEKVLICLAVCIMVMAQHPFV